MHTYDDDNLSGHALIVSIFRVFVCGGCELLMQLCAHMSDDDDRSGHTHTERICCTLCVLFIPNITLYLSFIESDVSFGWY